MSARRLATLVAVVAVSLAAILPLGYSQAARPAASNPHLYVVFLPGICGWTGSDRYCKGTINAAARATGTFRTLIGQLGAAKIRYSPIFYSYRPGSSTYTVNDTHSSVARDVTGLEGQLRAVSKRDSKAKFVLAGHSLGGVIAASWAVSTGRQYGLNPSKGLLRTTLNIITFDSPVKGLYGRFWTNPVVRLFAGPAWYSLQTTSETIKEIVFFPDSWWRSTGHLHTIANSADEVVPPPESLLGDKKLVFDSHCSTDLLIFKTCHGTVLSDVTLNKYVACHWVTGPCACSPRPTATPTRIPSPTTTATVTPTAVPAGTSGSGGPPPPPVAAAIQPGH
jgi:pimeloyl-ACP methyl ester carboxylesterase